MYIDFTRLILDFSGVVSYFLGDNVFFVFPERENGR